MIPLYNRIQEALGVFKKLPEHQFPIYCIYSRNKSFVPECAEINAITELTPRHFNPNIIQVRLHCTRSDRRRIMILCEFKNKSPTYKTLALTVQIRDAQDLPNIDDAVWDIDNLYLSSAPLARMTLPETKRDD